ncbi:hypothetical protein KM043_010887 [Ampulex compressa]|nr:hypothetical protein KM043_010887 [Ampulex compressa]
MAPLSGNGPSEKEGRIYGPISRRSDLGKYIGGMYYRGGQRGYFRRLSGKKRRYHRHVMPIDDKSPVSIERKLVLNHARGSSQCPGSAPRERSEIPDRDVRLYGKKTCSEIIKDPAHCYFPRFDGETAVCHYLESLVNRCPRRRSGIPTPGAERALGSKSRPVMIRAVGNIVKYERR